jgi:hypothetical protein
LATRHVSCLPLTELRVTFACLSASQVCFSRPVSIPSSPAGVLSGRSAGSGSGGGSSSVDGSNTSGTGSGGGGSYYGRRLLAALGVLEPAGLLRLQRRRLLRQGADDGGADDHGGLRPDGVSDDDSGAPGAGGASAAAEGAASSPATGAGAGARSSLQAVAPNGDAAIMVDQGASSGWGSLALWPWL